ncbi:hypothetical protein SAMN05444678_103169 [Sphingomonas sp. YR710]|uniref:hypothetical protein n=1 Tax=Sphingomonas sp. YR710 TaxID=1882773 RepID=UPI000881EF6B|nr:hypothetical protein [Sphingomonas sp. YR710]SDC48389.1 hypothetical protein SAMN05444678_103169 [Sphingomonas sp. YR710]
MLNNQRKRVAQVTTIGFSPLYSDGIVSFGAVVDGSAKKILVTADLLEEHALRRPMSAPELEAYTLAHRDLLLRAAQALSAATPHIDSIVIDRIEQLV